METNEYWVLIAKQLSRESTSEEDAALADWLALSPENRTIFEEVKRDWHAKQRERVPVSLQRGKAMVFERIEREQPNVPESCADTNVKWLGLSTYLKIAAAIVLMVVGVQGYRSMVGETTAPLMVSTNGKQHHPEKVVLPDGSTVWLNAGSTIRYADRFVGEVREVYLTGEAFFEVQRDEDKPFLVYTEGVTTRVLGTSFNIQAYPEAEAIEVTVSSGKVSVVDSTGVLGELSKNQQIAYHKHTGISMRQVVDATAANVWKEGKLVFDDQSLLAVAQRLERRYGVQITFAQASIKACPVTAQFDEQESLEKILYMICLVSNTKYEFQDEKQILISGQGCSISN
ncbi:FecR family protein [Dyadobacter jejuensis]|nr:FecR domain-containing protein [Dyadobacter jejuensis]